MYIVPILAGGDGMRILTFAVLLWLFCGVAGGWMLDGYNMHLKAIALGPISLVKGFNDTPVTYRGPR
jgi:hypothetical protein